MNPDEKLWAYVQRRVYGYSCSEILERAPKGWYIATFRMLPAKTAARRVSEEIMKYKRALRKAIPHLSPQLAMIIEGIVAESVDTPFAA